jgi:hypothetical protein
MNKLTLIVFVEDNLIDVINKQHNRIMEEFANDPVVITDIDAGDANSSLLRNCIFLMPEESDVVLVDFEKRIRGQYDVSSLEEMDRLIVEMKIILKRY